MSRIATFAAGLLFGVGLLVSGMTDPNRVRGFLDVAGAWDPSLAFVMGGALLVHAAAYRWITRLGRPLLADRFHIPTRTSIDGRLVAGAAIFGVGWGLSGICPGPAVVNLGVGASGAAIFALAGVVGMLAYSAWASRSGAG